MSMNLGFNGLAKILLRNADLLKGRGKKRASWDDSRRSTEEEKDRLASRKAKAKKHAKRMKKRAKR